MGCLLTILGPLLCLVSVGHGFYSVYLKDTLKMDTSFLFLDGLGLILCFVGPTLYAKSWDERRALERIKEREVRISEKVESLTAKLLALDFDSICKYEKGRGGDSRLNRIITLAHAIKDGDYNTAISIIEKNHEFADLLMHIGHKCAETNNYVTAERCYSAAYKYTKNQNALLHLGICYLFLEKYEQAQKYLTQTIQKDPIPLAWYNLLIVQSKLSNTDAFLNIYRQAMQDHKFVQYMKKDKKTKIVVSIPLDTIQGGTK